VEALIKEKKEKENVLMDLELMNLKNISLLNSKELITRIIEAEKKSWWRKIRNIGGIYNSCRHNWRL